MTYFISFALFVAVLAAGYVSGNQPARDAVASFSEESGVALESQQVDVGDVTLHVVLAGPPDGEPVVLLHGYPEFWYAWRGPMAVLARAGFRVIVPDQRGYNDSEKPGNYRLYSLDRLAADVSGLIEALGYDKAHLAGHDFGGLVSWWTLILHPERIDKFVVINKPHPQAILEHQGSGGSVRWYRTFLRIPWLPDYVGRLWNWELLARNLRDTSEPGTFPEGAMDLYRSAWDNDGAIGSMGAWYRANASFQMNVDVKITNPGLFVLAPADAFSSREMAYSSLRFLSNGELVEMKRGTHWVIQEEPQRIGDILIDFFRDGGS